MHFGLEGVIWLFLATVAEVPPAVGPCHFFFSHISSPLVDSKMFIDLDLNGSSRLSPGH